VFSFAVLEKFRYHHLEGKGNAYTFMNALYRLTDDTGRVGSEVRVSRLNRYHDTYLSQPGSDPGIPSGI
jgi:hypothetical protein